MNPECLIAHFNRISDAPDAIRHFRRFIIDLSVRGKLVEQDPSDEPASELIERVKKERKRLYKEKTSKNDKISTEIREAEKPYLLPTNWEWIRLGECLEMINGRAFKPTDWLPAGLPIVRIQNLNTVNAPFNYCNESTVEQRHIIESGCFLISWSGTPGTSFGAFIWERGRAALNQHIFRCIPVGDAYYDRFLQIAINGRLDEMIAKAHGGVGLQHITKGKLENLPLSLPPLPEQHRIVAKVDELMALCDRLDAAKSQLEIRRDRLAAASHHHLNNSVNEEAFRNHAHLYLSHLPRFTTHADEIKQLRQTILNLAVRGMLVKTGEDFSAMRLLQTVKTDRLRMRSTNSDLAKTAAEFETLERQRNNKDTSNAYITARCACHFITKGTTPAPEKLLQKGEVPFIKVYNIIDNKLDFDYKPSFVSRAVHENELRRSKALPGDVLMNIVGPPLGKVALVTDQYPEWNVNQAIAIFRPLSSFDSRFLMIVLSSLATIAEVLKETRGVVGQDNLSLEQVRSLKIPLLPLAHQRSIVAKVDELMALCDRLEEQLTTAQTESRQLLESVLYHALNDSLQAAVHPNRIELHSGHVAIGQS